VGRPIGRHKVFRDGSDRLVDVYLVFDTDGAMIEFTESAKGQNKIHAADMTGFMHRCTLVIEAGDDGVEFFAGVDRPVDVESIEVDIDDDFEHGSVLGQPDYDAGRGETGRRAGGEGEGGGDSAVAGNSEGKPRGGIARFDRFVAGTVATGSKAVVVDCEIFSVAGYMKSEVTDGAWRDAKVSSEFLGIGHVIAIGVGALGC